MDERELSKIIEVPEWKTILLDLVERNELDPWSIDIVKLTNLYIEEIRRMRSIDLYVPANAVLASSILLWLKSRVLREVKEELEEKEEEKEIIELPEPEETFDIVVAEPEPVGEIVPPSRLIRRTVSLDELLDVMEKLMKKSVKRRVSVEPLPEAEELFERLEEEDVEDYVGEVYGEIKRLADTEGMVLFSDLVKGDVLDFVRTLLALLYLASEGKVELVQEEVFGEIIVRLAEG